MADFRQRIYLTIISAPVAAIVFTVFAMAFGWPFRVAIIMAVLAFGVSLVDLATRAKACVEVSSYGLRFKGRGLLKPAAAIRADDIIEITAITAPLAPWGVPLITAYYLMPMPIGTCVAVRTRQTPLNWVRWHGFRVEDREAFLDAVRHCAPQVKIDASLMGHAA